MSANKTLAGLAVIEPVRPLDRLRALDAVRGLALFGVLIVNAETEFRVSIFEQFVGALRTSSGLDQRVEQLVSIGIEFKAFMVFSFLFGIGLAIQFERFSRDGRPYAPLVRRLSALLVIGLVHLVCVWNGDILTEYAIAGFLVLPLLNASKRSRLFLSCVFFLLYLVTPLFLPAGLFPSPSWMAEHVHEAQRVFEHGTFLDVRAFEIAEIPYIIPLHVFVFGRTVALMLLGAFAWQAGLLEVGRPRGSGFWICTAVGVGLWATLRAVAPGSVPPLLQSALDLLAQLALAGAYVSACLALAGTAIGVRILRIMEPVGRMAFSNYLLQSVLLGALFYGYGLGLRARLGAAETLAICVGLFTLQIVLSSWWLQRYQFGPMEWLWRSVTYWKRQPLRATPA